MTKPACPLCGKPVGKHHAHLEVFDRLVPIHRACLGEWEDLLQGERGFEASLQEGEG